VSTDLVLDPRSYGYHENPFDHYRRLREEAPLYWNDELQFWALSRYEDVAQASADWRSFCSGAGVTLRGPHRPPQMISQDPPRHTVLRSLVRKSFTARSVGRLELDIRGLCRHLLEDLGDRRTFDCISEYAELVPMAVISWVLGMDDGGDVKFHQLMNRFLHRTPGTSEPTADGLAAEAEALTYITGLLDDPQATRPHSLVRAIGTAARDEVISRPEAIGMVFQLLIAGFETTKKLVGNAIVALHRAPAQRALILGDPALIANAIEETLRFDGPTPHMFRTATAEATRYGRTIREGDKVMLLFASANRDERRWPQPDVFDVTRDTRGHVGFGHGIHLCLGAALARLEARIALEVFLKRFAEFNIVESRRSHTDNNRGFSRLTIETNG
jgi:cytochrome P450